MPPCHAFLSVTSLCLLMVWIGTTTSFVVKSPCSTVQDHLNARRPRHTKQPVAVTTALLATSSETTTVEVCGFKDCKRAGGGPRLEKLVKQVVEEQAAANIFTVEGCDCQGECGYGPNLVVNGKIVNNVKGKDAILRALGIDDAIAEEEA